jgi:hypothetical protein
MSKKEFIVVAVFFGFLTLAFFYKIFQGLIPLPADIVVGGYYPWHDYKWGLPTGVPIKNPIITDAVSIMYPLRNLAIQLLKNGELPLWNWQIFGGYPLFASTSTILLFPTTIFYLLFKFPQAWTFQTMFQPFLALIFMYLLLRHLKLGKLSSIFGSIAYAFSGSIMIWLEWNSQATTAIFLPLLILCVDKFLENKKISWGILLSLSFAFQIFAGYFLIIIFSSFAIILWLILKGRFIQNSLRLAPFFILGLGLSSIFLLPGIELLHLSQRSFENQKDVFLPFEYIVSFLAPDFFGNHATANFWGQGNYLNVAIYTGIVTFIFGILGTLLNFSKKEVRFCLLLIVLTLIIMFPNPLGSLIYKSGLWGGQSVTMNRASFLINFSLALLSAYGLESLNEKKYQLVNTVIFHLFRALLFLLLSILVIKYTFKIYLSEEIISNLTVTFKNLIIPTTLVTLVGISFYIASKIKLKVVYLKVFLIILLTAELFRFGLKFNSFSPQSFLYPKTEVSQFLEKYPNERFLSEKDVFPANMWMPQGFESIAGYDAAYPVNIAKLIAVANSGDPKAATQTKNGMVSLFTTPLIERTATRFVLAVKKGKIEDIRPDGKIDKQYSIPKYHPVLNEKTVVVMENENSLSRAYLVGKAIKEDKAQILKDLLDPNFQINRIALTADFEFDSNSNSQFPKPSYKRLTNNHIEVKTESQSEAFLVVLDTFYPGWKATIDSKPAKIYQTNYAFRGVLLPAGRHTVDFIYRPESLIYGAIISLISLLIMTFLFILSKKKTRPIPKKIS